MKRFIASALLAGISWPPSVGAAELVLHDAYGTYVVPDEQKYTRITKALGRVIRQDEYASAEACEASITDPAVQRTIFTSGLYVQMQCFKGPAEEVVR